MPKFRLVLSKLFHKIGENITTTFYKKKIILIQQKRKIQLKIEYCRTIILITIDAKFLKNNIVNQKHEHSKGIIFVYNMVLHIDCLKTPPEAQISYKLCT